MKKSKKSKRRLKLRKIRTSPFYKKTLRKLKRNAKRNRKALARRKKSTGRRKHRASSPRPYRRRGTPANIPTQLVAHFYAPGKPAIHTVIVAPKKEQAPSHLVLERKSAFQTRKYVERELDDVLVTMPNVLDAMIEEALNAPARTTRQKIAKALEGLPPYDPEQLRSHKLSRVEREFLAINRQTHSPFLWATHKTSDVLEPRKMATEHVFYSLRMLFNNTVPPTFRVVVPGELFKRYEDVELSWSAAYKQQAITEFAKVLSQRTDLERHMEQQLRDMTNNAKVILSLGL